MITAKDMGRFRPTPRLGINFVLAVVIPSLVLAGLALSEPRAEASRFISKSLTLEDITREASSGLISRFTEDGLSLLSWKKEGGGKVAGCALDMGRFQKRMAGLIPDLYSPSRILTLLDERGRPRPLLPGRRAGIGAGPSWPGRSTRPCPAGRQPPT